MAKNIRKAYVSGKFYPSDDISIKEMITQMKEREKSRINYSLPVKNIFGAVLPHAGHIYSGYQTLHFFEILKQTGIEFDTWIIIHPLHSGGELDLAVDGSDFWNTPLGDVMVDQEIVEILNLPVSSDMHRFEHSSEVILPFIQHYNRNNFSFVSIGMARQNPGSVKKISDALIQILSQTEKKICLVASSDFSHYVHPEIGKKMDQNVLDRILNKEENDIYWEVTEKNLSVCGYGPIMAVCKTLNTFYPENIPIVLARGNSGEVHHSDSVVDYISILFYS